MELSLSFTDQDSYREWKNGDDPLSRWQHHQKILENLRSSSSQTAKIWGWCDVCANDCNFLLDDLYSDTSQIPWQPNWRERLACTNCLLNARMRASFSLTTAMFESKSKIWISEQTTSYYRILSSKYENLIGSEYFGASFKPGEILKNGMRNEDCTDTSFESETLDGVLSFDVMEHLPQYITAIKEAFRILRPKGLFFWTAPFNINEETTSLRAKLLPDGTIKHLMDPIMHGDPINPSEGILCFQIFGWDILRSLRDAGFSEVKVVLFWSKSQVILGDPLPFFVARK